MNDDGSRNHNRLLSILTLAIENTNEAFITIDQDHKVLVFNRAAERIFGYPREEVVGRDLRLILGPGCREGHQEAVERFKKTRKPHLIGHENEFTAMRKNGELFPASLSFSVAEVDEQLYFTAIMRDMTETKQLQEQVMRAERLAALGQIVAEINHEIKNPLMLIGGLARQLLKKTEDEKSRLKLTTIAAEISRLEELLAGMRDLYLPRQLKLEEVDLNQLVNEVHDLVNEECRRRQIDLELHLDPARPLTRADRSRLQQVLLNLAKNGMEALMPGGHLTIFVTTKEPGMAQVIVADNGPGISQELQEKIFAPFYTTKRKGTGLGLAVSRRIVNEHPRARFELESEEGRGARFILSFPRFSPQG
jgi:two-component system, LuxR family, sensor kinase FixL